MFKKLIAGTIAAGALFAFTASAGAAEINIWGASAQHKLWQNLVPNWVASQGCSPVQTAQVDKKNVITWGQNCTGLGGDDLYVRYGDKASYDGILALLNQVDPSSTPECANNTDRKMADEDTCDFAAGTCTGTKCVPITVGSSDVPGNAFRGFTMGNEDGHLGGPFISVFFDDAGIDTSSLLSKSPVAVPFGFVANNQITKTRCVNPRPDYPDGIHKAYSKWQWECVPGRGENALEDESEDCIGYYKCVYDDVDARYECAGGTNMGNPCSKPQECPDVALSDTECMAMPIDNISRLMAVLIFSGAVDNWNQFGPWYPDLTITKCMRHVGSGTHATMDAVVMRGDGTLIAADSNSGAPNTWHYRSSSDLMYCAKDFAGGIGYVDADKLADDTEMDTVHYVRYQGVEATREKIRHCEYPFFSTQYGYYKDDNNKALVESLYAYASNPYFLNWDKIGIHAEHWAAACELDCDRLTMFSYPIWKGADCPMVPANCEDQPAMEDIRANDMCTETLP